MKRQTMVYLNQQPIQMENQCSAIPWLHCGGKVKLFYRIGLNAFLHPVGRFMPNLILNAPIPDLNYPARLISNFRVVCDQQEGLTLCIELA